MKKTILTAFLILSSFFVFSQNCIRVVSSYFENPSGDNTNWRLVINYTSDGTKHVNTVIKNNNTIILDTCFETLGNGQNTGTVTYPFVSPNSTLLSLKATFYRYTGRCGGGIVCDSAQNLIGNVLPIKITNLIARNIKNTTEITFKIESIDDRQLTFNFTLKNGQKKKYDIVLPDYADNGQTWVVTIDNINGTYKTKKL